MTDIYFFLKMMALTAVVVLLMQIRFGEDTIETHTMSFLTSSTLVQPVDQTASATVIFVRNTWRKITSAIDTNFSNALREENRPGSRQKFFSVKRGEQIARETAAGAKEAAGHIRDNAREGVAKSKKFIDETAIPGMSANRAGSYADDENVE